MEGAAGRGRGRDATGSSCRSGSATSGSPNHSRTTRSSTSRGWTLARPPRSCCGLSTGLRRPFSSRSAQAGGAQVPRHDPVDLERAGQERRLHRARRNAGEAPRQAGRGRVDGRRRPGPVRAGRGGQDPARPGVCAPVHGRLRPGLVGAIGAVRGDQPRARRAGQEDGSQGRRQRGRGGRGGSRGTAPGRHSALAAHLRQRGRPQAAGAVSAHRVGPRASSRRATRPGAHAAEPLEVDVFSSDESVAHLLRHVPELDLAEPTRSRMPWVTCRWRSSRPARGWNRPG